MSKSAGGKMKATVRWCMGMANACVYSCVWRGLCNFCSIFAHVLLSESWVNQLPALLAS